jgi:putative DNA primase/helicase
MRHGQRVNPVEYIARGWAVLPCHSVRPDGSCTCGKDCAAAGKHPRTLHGVKDATTDPATIQRWSEMFGHDVNWAVATGEVSGIVVVDVDPRNGGDQSLAAWTEVNGDLPVTLTTLTGGGGYHYFFRYPRDGGPVTNRPNFLPGVDFKSDGGYVLLPQARHKSGRQYAWRDQRTEVVSLPDTLLHAVRNSATEPKKIDTSDLTKIASGERNDTLFRLACRLRRQLNDDRLAVEASVRAYNTFRCSPPLDEVEISKIIDSAWRQDHTDADIARMLTTAAGIRNLTDDGNAHRLVDYHGADLRYVPTWGWMRWVGHAWVGDSEGLSVQDRARLVNEDIRREIDQVSEQDLQDRLRKWAGQSEGVGRIEAMMKLAKSDSRILRAHEAFDVSGTLLSCRNGVLDLTTGQLRDHAPDDYITRCTNVDYDPDAQLDEWEAFVHHACDDDPDLVSYVQRAAGYSLSGSVTEECFFVIVGPAASGKSTFVSGMQAALGEYAGSFASDTILLRGQQSRRESDLATTIGRRFVSVVEMPEGERLDESVVKQLTGGDAVTARFLFKNPFTFKPQYKLWIATNHEPRINDDAIWRRIKRIPFPRGLPSGQRNPRVKELISNPEVGGRAVLAWAVRGYQMYLKERLYEPDRVVRETQAYHMRQDKIGQFLDEVGSVSGEAEHRLEMTDLYMRYTSWCSVTGERAWTMSSFASRLDGRQGITTTRLNGQHWVRGIKLRVSNTHAATGGSAWGL